MLQVARFPIALVSSLKHFSISYYIQWCESIGEKKSEMPEKDVLFNAFRLH